MKAKAKRWGSDLVGYSDLRIPEEPVEITEEQVGEALKYLRYEAAPWEPVDRPAQFGDLVNLDVHAWAGSQEIINSKGTDYIPTEGSENPVPGFAEALQGVGAGEAREFTLDLAQDYADETLAGKSCRFQVKVTEIKAKHLAELDDEFAKGVGQGHESLEALKDKLREDLVREREQGVRRQYEEKVLQATIEGASVDMSPLFIEREIDHLLRDQEEALKQRRLSMEQYLQTVGKTEEQIREELRPMAEARVKRSLVLDKVAQVEGIEVTEEDVQREIDSLPQGSAQQGSSARRLFSSPNGRESLRRMLLHQKTLQRLADIARGSVDGASPPAAGEEVADSQSLLDPAGQEQADDGGKEDG